MYVSKEAMSPWEVGIGERENTNSVTTSKRMKMKKGGDDFVLI